MQFDGFYFQVVSLPIAFGSCPLSSSLFSGRLPTTQSSPSRYIQDAPDKIVLVQQEDAWYLSKNPVHKNSGLPSVVKFN